MSQRFDIKFIFCIDCYCSLKYYEMNFTLNVRYVQSVCTLPLSLLSNITQKMKFILYNIIYTLFTGV